MVPMQNVMFFGFGEAGEAFATGLGSSGNSLSGYDVKLDAPSERTLSLQAMARAGVQARTLDGLAEASVVLCLVTADQALAAARAASRHLLPGTFWFDGNSCSPGTKRQAAEVIASAGGRYVDLAVMAPVYPKRHRTPLLASGPDAVEGAALLTAWGMQVRVTGDRVGHASSIKMLRSVIVKGLEALTAEAFLAARAAGVEEEVIASLQASDPGVAWAARGAYNLERMMVHGTRRAAEMAEVAATLRELGLPDRMAQATVPWQAEIAALALDPGRDDLATRADAILGSLR